jgi:hypothetical protein
MEPSFKLTLWMLTMLVVHPQFQPQIQPHRNPFLHQPFTAPNLSGIGARLIAKTHFRKAQTEVVLAVSSIKLFNPVIKRAMSSASLRAMKSQNQSAFSRNHRRSIGLKSGEYPGQYHGSK